MMVEIPHCPRRTASGHARIFYQGALVNPQAQNDLVALNPTALALWELCDGRTTTEEMVAAVCELFAVDPTQARRDVEAALADMVEKGVVR